MHIADLVGAEYRIVMRGRRRITHEFTITIALIERDGHHTVVIGWLPEPPPWAVIDALSLEIAAATTRYHRRAMQLGGLRVVGDS